MKGYMKTKLTFMLSLLLVLSACSDPEPIKLGFIGGTSGRVADLGVAGRNGFLLAVEQQNQRGGINGRPIEFIFKDDKQNPQIAIEAVEQLLEEDVAAIIGPMTSAMALATVEQMNQAQKVMMACTVTTDQLTGVDDYFLRPLSAIKAHSGNAAVFVTERHPEVRTATMVIDMGNEAYTRDWARGFQEKFERSDNRKANIETFTSSNDTDFFDLGGSILAGNPDVVVLIMNSIDAAILSKQLKRARPELILVAAEWAGTERLVELGGSYIDGLYVGQFINRESEKPSFIAFQDAYHKRFNQKPGYPGMFCYNATSMVIAALQVNDDPKAVKQELLKLRDFQGVQGKVRMDNFGDSHSPTYMTQIQNGIFKVIGE